MRRMVLFNAVISLVLFCSLANVAFSGAPFVPTLVDPPDSIAGAPLLDGNQMALQEFSRDESNPDIDVFETNEFVGGTRTVAVFPSFFVFDEIFTRGNVTIEVLNETGGLHPSTIIDPSINPLALTQVDFDPSYTGKYYFRLTPSSGLHFGEYAIALFFGFGPDAFPNRLKQAVSGRYTELPIPGQIQALVSTGTFRFGFHALVNVTTRFTINQDSSINVIELYLIADNGIIDSVFNLTVTAQGIAVFEFVPEESKGYLVVIKLPGGTNVVVTSEAGEPNLSTFACVQNIPCQPGSLTLTGLRANEPVIVQVLMKGDHNSATEKVAFVDGLTAAAIGSYGTLQCPVDFAEEGFLATFANGQGQAQLDWSIGTATDICVSFSLVQLRYQALGEFLEEDSSVSTATASSACLGNTCADATLNFANVAAGTGNLSLAYHGLAGETLVVRMGGVVVFNKSVSAACDFQVGVIKIEDILTKQGTVSVSYTVTGATVCSDVQSFVLGYLSVNPSKSNAGSDDSAIYAVIGVSCFALVAAGAYLFVQMRKNKTKSIVVKD